MLRLLLGLALGGQAAPAVPAPVETVRAVRIETEEAARLRPLVGIEPGQPLDREAVRRAVELIFATGRFEDVQAELERDERGASLVFRVRPAPLLREVRVVGDQVLSPGRVRRLARLRAGEPLWPQRRERAGRDLGLALQERGHLEALVDVEAVSIPGGAAAQVRIHAGPRVLTGRLAVQGDATLPLEHLARPRSGEVYRKARADAAAETMRRALVASGRWRAAVRVQETYDPAAARMALAFVASSGPRVRVQVRGAELPASLLDGVRDLVRDGGASGDAVEAGAERIETHLRALGHRDATVRARTEPEPAGEAVVFDVSPGERALVASVQLRGAEAVLLDGLRTRPGRPLEDAALEEDARQVTSRLEAAGYFEARVETDVQEGGGELQVAFLAQPGPRAVVSAFDVEGPPLPASSEDRAPQELTLRAGLPYRLADVARARDALLSAWRRVGHLDARIRVETQLSEARDAARVRLIVEPGPRTLVEHVVFAGLRRTRDTTVARELLLRPGQPFSFERVLESQRRLSALGIFERVTISELDPTRERRDVVVSAQEAPATSVSWGVGYSEQDRLRGSVELTRRNLGGQGRTASLFARGSFRGSRLLANLREPWLLGRRLDSFVTGFWEEERRYSFDYDRKGVTLQAGRALDARTTLIGRYLLQSTNVYNVTVPLEEIDRQYRTYTVSGPSASLVYDTRDDPLEPRRGLFLGADAQLSLAALGGESYMRGFLQAASVRRLRAELVLVVSGRLGFAGTFGSTPALLPLPERFFSGGDTGPRGFRYDAVGPQVAGADGERYATGGNALLLGGAELRYNLTRAFQLASFVDVGSVYQRVRELDLAELRRSAGLGVRYRTPVGPIRLDWGYVLDPRAGDQSRSRFHLTIGHAF